jgi:hypothetical protein
MRATALADEVTRCFEGFTIGGGDYIVELLAPEGQALQQLRLRPRRDGYRVIVAGSVNPVEKFAELRTFEHVFLVHEMRFAKAFEITAPEWEQLLRRAEAVLQLANIESARVGPSPSLLTNAREKKRGRRIPASALAAFIVVLTLATFVVVRVIQKVLAG